ncbi:MAG: hypothetical protein ACOCP4_03490 [Candidatus Woesearchaeota archaeon]
MIKCNENENEDEVYENVEWNKVTLKYEDFFTGELKEKVILSSDEIDDNMTYEEISQKAQEKADKFFDEQFELYLSSIPF